MGIFRKDEEAVYAALQAAASRIRDNSQSVFYHCDLFSQNVMVAMDGNGHAHISCIIDFGMSLFAPLAYSHYHTKKYGDFELASGDLPVPPEDEAHAYEILRIEPILLAHCFGYERRWRMAEEYVQRCKAYMESA